MPSGGPLRHLPGWQDRAKPPFLQHTCTFWLQWTGKTRGCVCLMCHHQLHPHSLAESFPMKSLLLDSVAWRLAGLAVLLLVIWLVYGAVV